MKPVVVGSKFDLLGQRHTYFSQWCNSHLVFFLPRVFAGFIITYLKITPILAFCCQKTTSGIIDCRASNYCSKKSILKKSRINAFDRIPYWDAVVSLHSKIWYQHVLEVYLTLTLKKTCITLHGKPEFSCVEAGLWLVIITRPSRFWQIIDIKCCILYSAAPFLGLCKAILQISSSISSQSVVIIFFPVYI